MLISISNIAHALLCAVLISKLSNYHKYFLEHNIKHYNSSAAAGAVGEVNLLALVSMKVLKCVLLLNE